MSVPTATAAGDASTEVVGTDHIRRSQGHLALLPAVIRSEWTKLRSVRSTVWSLVATLGITVGFGVLLSWAYISRYDQISLRERLTFDPTAHSLRGLFLAQLAIGVLG